MISMLLTKVKCKEQKIFNNTFGMYQPSLYKLVKETFWDQWNEISRVLMRSERGITEVRKSYYLARRSCPWPFDKSCEKCMIKCRG